MRKERYTKVRTHALHQGMAWAILFFILLLPQSSMAQRINLGSDSPMRKLQISMLTVSMKRNSLKTVFVA